MTSFQDSGGEIKKEYEFLLGLKIQLSACYKQKGFLLHINF